MKNSKDVFLKLLKAETEEQITTIIQKEGMNKENDWQPYGGEESNWSIIGNQSSSAERALVEKVTNSVDALLMRRCLELGIDPKTTNAPKSPKQALIDFFNIKDGKSENLTKEQEELICNDLMLMATSDEMKPIKKLGRNAHVNMLVYDGGEGQSPNRLPKTILSLLAGNKQGISFTQGNYNQGGSGSLMYCGEKSYCLVVSKRHPNIDKRFTDSKDDSIHQWGWTLIRLEMRKDTKDPMFTYYAPNGKVPRIDSDTLPLKPKMIRGKEAQKYLDYGSSCSAGLPYEEETNYGTLIKMYNYNLKQKGPLVSHFKYEMSRCILDTYLPFYVIDCRKNKFNNHTSFRGFRKILEDDLNESNPERKLINKHFPLTNKFWIENQEVLLTTYGLNQRKAGEKDEKSFIGESSPIRFTLGQQFQGEVNRTIISNAGLGVLKDSLLMLVEFPNLDPVFKKDLFMTDRERLLDKKPKKEIIQRIKTFLSQDETLQSFASEKMQKIMSEQTANDPSVKSALEKWLENSPDMQNALGFGEWFPGKGKTENGKGVPIENPPRGVSVTLPPDPIETKEIPTYFDPLIRTNNEDELFATVTKGKRFTIRFKTNASEDFFDRINKQGKATVHLNGKITDQYSINIKNGKASFYFTDKLTKKLGEHDLKIDISCNGTVVSFIYEIKLIVQEPVTDSKGKGSDEKNTFQGLPPFIEITKDHESWSEDMNEESGATIQTLNDHVQYLINMDNVYLQTKLNNLKSEGEKEYYRKLYTYAMLFSAMATKNTEEEKRKSQEREESDEPIETTIAKATERVAQTLFVMEQLSSNLRNSLSLV
jgi:hypothetical protein